MTSVLTRVAAIFGGGVEQGSLLRLRFREDSGGVELPIASSMSATGLEGVVERPVASSLISTVPSRPNAKVEISFELRVFGRALDRTFEEIALKMRVVSCETLEVRILVLKRCLCSCRWRL